MGDVVWLEPHTTSARSFLIFWTVYSNSGSTKQGCYSPDVEYLFNFWFDYHHFLSYLDDVHRFIPPSVLYTHQKALHQYSILLSHFTYS